MTIFREVMAHLPIYFVQALELVPHTSRSAPDRQIPHRHRNGCLLWDAERESSDAPNNMRLTQSGPQEHNPKLLPMTHL